MHDRTGIATHDIALNEVLDATATATCAIALDPHGGIAPDWIEVLPPGPLIMGRDGRDWLHDRPQAVVDAFNAESQPLVIDWEHATEFSTAGQPAPAAGWIDALELRDGSTWARVAWNPRGADSVANREYRYLSPVFAFERDSSRIVRLLSVALTNRPNLQLRALNRPLAGSNQEDVLTMDPELLRLLGLAANASVAEACTAVTALQSQLTTAQAERDTALNRAHTPDLAQFVPRADYDAVLERATNAEQHLSDQVAEARRAEVERALNEALEDGKITPATVEYYRASCHEEGGLERFRTFVEAAPTIAADSGLGHRTPNAGGGLTPEQKAMCVALGITEEDYAKSLAQTADAV